MAEEKRLNARLCQKIDTEENWNKATNFVPMKGEVIIYTDNDGKNERIKIGNGIDLVGDLDFVPSGLKAWKQTDDILICNQVFAEPVDYVMLEKNEIIDFNNDTVVFCRVIDQHGDEHEFTFSEWVYEEDPESSAYGYFC